MKLLLISVVLWSLVHACSGFYFLTKVGSILQLSSSSADTLRTLVQLANGTTIECTESSAAIDEFPNDLFTAEQRQHGAVILHIIGVLYFFTVLAVICNDYFLPSVEFICENLKISEDVAAATFMASATTVPEFFTNVIGAFLTKSNVGVGTIIGSLTFNTLCVAALAAIFTPQPLQLDWFPITRDCLLYGIHTILLIVFTWNGYIHMYEAAILVTLYFVYFFIMYMNDRIAGFVKSKVELRGGCCNRFKDPPGLIERVEHFSQITKDIPEPRKRAFTISKNASFELEQNENKSVFVTFSTVNNTTVDFAQNSKLSGGIWVWPNGTTSQKLWWIYTWPIKFIFTVLIPNPKVYRRLYLLTFAMCMAAIAFNSYLIVWMITVIGDTLGIPDTIMGMTILAAGGCMPEAMSSIISARKSESGIGVSNAIGANSLCILLSLGCPWLIRIIMDGGDPIVMDSVNMRYTIIMLLIAVILLYTILSLGKHRLKRTVGFSLLTAYLVVSAICILNQMNIFFPIDGC